MRERGRFVLAAFAVFTIASCGARTELDSGDETRGAGGAELACPALATCDGASDECRGCVNERLAACGQIADCDPGPDDCSGALPERHACRVWAVEAVECLLDCSSEKCSNAYFGSGRGPIYPLGLAFNDYTCAVCKSCSAECAGTPNFQLICNPH